MKKYFLYSIWSISFFIHSAHTQPREILPHEPLKIPAYKIDARKSEPIRIVEDSSSQKIRALEQQAQSSKKTIRSSAQWQLGLLQLHGIQTTKDPVKANTNFLQAFENGNQLALSGMIWCAIDGCGQPPSLNEARRLNELLKRSNRARSLFFDWLIDKSFSPLEVYDKNFNEVADQEKINILKKNNKSLFQAADLGDIQAKNEIGLLYASVGLHSSASQIFKSFENLNIIGKENFTAINIRNSTERNHGANGNIGQTGAAWQTYKQARIYHRGEGVPVNYTEAIRLYKRAADMGNEASQRMLALIYSRPDANGQINIAWMQQLAFMDPSTSNNMLSANVQAPVSLKHFPTGVYDYINSQWLQ